MLNGCAFFVAKETARAITIVAEDSKDKSEDKYLAIASMNGRTIHAQRFKTIAFI